MSYAWGLHALYFDPEDPEEPEEEMSEPLWDAERVVYEMQLRIAELDNECEKYVSVIAKQNARIAELEEYIDSRMITEYEQRIAELEAQLEAQQQQWTPVAKRTRIMCACGEEQCFRAVKMGTFVLEMYQDVSDVESKRIMVDLPDHIRLCERKPAPDAV